VTDSRPATDGGTADAPGRGLADRAAWYIVAWVVVSGLLVLLVTRVDRSPGPPNTHPAGRVGAAAVATAGPAQHGAPPDRSVTAAGSGDWTLAVSYTPVESFHHGPVVRVAGCLRVTCDSRGDLGGYPADFVAAVQAEGSGRITSGVHAGAFLGWAAGVGYWLDTAPRDSRGKPLTAFTSAGSGTPLLSLRTRLRILACGADESGAANDMVCARLRAATWVVAEVRGPSPTRSVTLYVGAESGPGFADGRWNTTFSHAVLRIG